jgi:WD40 repeat protein
MLGVRSVSFCGSDSSDGDVVWSAGHEVRSVHSSVACEGSVHSLSWCAHRSAVGCAGRRVLLFRCDEMQQLVISHILAVSDWTLHAVFCRASFSLVSSVCHSHVALLSAHGVVTVLDTLSHTVVASVAPPVRVALLCSGRLVALSSDASRLRVVCGGFDGVVTSWTVNVRTAVVEGDSLVELRGHKGAAHCVDACFLDGEENDASFAVACGADDRSVTVWCGSRRIALWGNAVRPWAVRWSGNTLVCGGEDGTLRWWTCARNGEWSDAWDVVLQANRSGVRCVDVAGNKVVCGGDDGSVTVWDTARAAALFRTSQPAHVVEHAGFCRAKKGSSAIRLLCCIDGDVFACVDATVFRWSREKGVTEWYRASASAAPVVFLGRTASGSLALVHKDGKGALLSLDGGQNELINFGSSVICCALNETRSHLCIMSWDGRFLVLDVQSGKAVWHSDRSALAKGESTTCATVIRDNVIVAGVSDGSILVCARSANGEHASSRFRACHSDAVTDVALDAVELSGVCRFQLFSSCKDGRIGHWAVDCNQSPIRLSRMNVAKPRCVGLVESVEGFVRVAPNELLARVHTCDGGFWCRMPADSPECVLGFVRGLAPRSLAVAEWNEKQQRLVGCALLPGESRVSVFEWPSVQFVRSIIPSAHAAIVNLARTNHERALLATASDDGRWALWSLREPWQNRALLWRKTGNSVRAMTWCSDHRLLVASHEVMQLWTASGDLLWSTRMPVEENDSSRRCMWLVCVTSKQALFGDSGGWLCAVDIDSGTFHQRMQLAKHCLSAACRLDDKHVAVVDSRGYFYRVATSPNLEVLAQLRTSKAALSGVAAVGGTVVCVGDDPNHVYVIDARGTLHILNTTHDSSIMAVGMRKMPQSDESLLVATLSQDQTVCFCRLALAPDLSYRVFSRVSVAVAHPTSLDWKYDNNRTDSVDDASAIFVTGANGFAICETVKQK